MDYTKITLGEFLSSDDATIKRNAMSILKICQACDHKIEHGRCIYCFSPKKDKRDYDRFMELEEEMAEAYLDSHDWLPYAKDLLDEEEHKEYEALLKKFRFSR